MTDELIRGFDPESFIEVLRSKFSSFSPLRRPIRLKKEFPWTTAEQLGIVKTLAGPNHANHPLLIAVARLPDGEPLRERASRLKQFRFARQVLDQAMAAPAPGIEGVIAQGLFAFYDDIGNFRLSLVFGKAQGRKLVWSSARRLSFYVEAGAVNRTFRARLDLDWSTFEKLKDAFSVEKLTREFYSSLFAWYQRAMAADDVFLPNDIVTDKEPGEVKSEQIIRLITRLMFVWFIKQKHLVPDTLFDPAELQSILRDFSPVRGDSYYRTILQNLFFATLNSEIDERAFAVDAGKRSVNVEHFDIKTLYRYGADFAISREAVLDLFRPIPFLNGGLFECLDRGKDYFDGFSRNSRKQARIPNRFFFDETDGLVTLLGHYNFTVEENAPGDQEVALDPELLGKVFENLLAAYNPETNVQARKATGSFYTPREIVNYMVDESLVAHLRTHVPEAAEDTLRALLGEEEVPVLSEPLRRRLVEAVFHGRVLDPACGSGAFPMGMLLKMVHLLQRLDPENSLWNEVVLGRTEADLKAAETLDAEEKRAHLQRVTEHFDQSVNEPDYTRKLYLIEYCLFGVDIQPIAVQIAKLRAFITLVCDQKPRFDDIAGNYGMLPLPNLETKFVAADSLIGLKKPRKEVGMGAVEVDFLSEEEDPEIMAQKNALWDVRHNHFRARSYREKKSLRTQDKQLRKKLAVTIKKKQGYSVEAAEKMAAWDPYDQNTSASFFDPEWMFNVKDGFDVVIGNPPYIQLQNNGGALAKYYGQKGFSCFDKTGDIYCLFYERGIQFLRSNGLLTYITSKTWMRNAFGKRLREFLLKNTRPVLLIDYQGIQVFDTATVNINIMMLQKDLQSSGKQAKCKTCVVRDDARDQSLVLYLQNHMSEQTFDVSESWVVLSEAERGMKQKIARLCKPLKEWNVRIYRGVLTGLNEAFLINREIHDRLMAEDPNSAKILRPILRGRDIQRYRHNWAGKWVIGTFPALNLNIDHYKAIKNLFLEIGKARLEQSGRRFPNGTKARKRTRNAWFETQDQINYHDEFYKEKIIWGEISDRTKFSYDDGSFCVEATAFFLTSPHAKFLLAILNSKMAEYLFSHIGTKTGMGTIRWKKYTIEQLPIPTAKPDQRAAIESLVERILAAKKADPAADVSALEAEIDRLVYRLYDLTPEEITIVEESGKAADAGSPTPERDGVGTPEARGSRVGLKGAPKKHTRKPSLPPSREGWE